MPDAEVRSARVPIVTIGGFLGAGKTTLVNQVLSSADGRRIVVFVNDFGAINIDHSLVETVEEDRISLKNGCVCCTLNDDLVASVADLARAASPPDMILIEASGVADPRALDASLAALEAAGLARLDTRLYVLDASTFDGLGYDLAEAVIDHAAASDLVLVNKTDLANAEQIGAVIRTLKEAAPFSRVVETAYAAIGWSILLDADGARSAERPSATKQIGDHARKYDQWSCEVEAAIDRLRFEDFAATLPETCLRAKGVLRFSDEPDATYLFNLVGYRATLERSKRMSGSFCSQIVAIGEKGPFDGSRLERAFSRAIAAAGS